MTDSDKVEPLKGEEQRMRLAVADVTLAWADVENLSAVILRRILDHQADGEIASAIYFAPSNTETRLRIVDRAFRQLVTDTEHETKISEAWSDIQKSLQHLKETRNKVAHGEIITHRSRGKSSIRLTAPLTDRARHRDARRTGQLPGLSANDLETSAKAVKALVERLHAAIPLVGALFSENEKVLLEAVARLRDHTRR